MATFRGGRYIVYAWAFTFPVCIIGGALMYWLLHSLGVGVAPVAAPPGP